MYTLTIEFTSAETLLQIAQVLAAAPEGSVKTIAPAATDKPAKPKKEEKKADPVEDVKPMTVPTTDEELAIVRADLRKILEESNKKGDAYVKKNRELLVSFEGARSISTCDPKHYIALKEGMLKIANA